MCGLAWFVLGMAPGAVAGYFVGWKMCLLAIDLEYRKLKGRGGD